MFVAVSNFCTLIFIRNTALYVSVSVSAIRFFIGVGTLFLSITTLNLPVSLITGFTAPIDFPEEILSLYTFPSQLVPSLYIACTFTGLLGIVNVILALVVALLPGKPLTTSQLLNVFDALSSGCAKISTVVPGARFLSLLISVSA